MDKPVEDASQPVVSEDTDNLGEIFKEQQAVPDAPQPIVSGEPTAAPSDVDRGDMAEPDVLLINRSVLPSSENKAPLPDTPPPDEADAGNALKKEYTIIELQEQTHANTEHAAPHDHPWWRHWLLAIAIAGFLIVVRIPVERTPWGESARLAAYRFIQTRLITGIEGRPNRVQVVDISDIPRVSGPDVSPGEPVTSRQGLFRCMEQLCTAGAKAIGVDVDFSEDESGNPVTMRDGEFLASYAHLTASHQVPIFVGVARQAAGKPQEWLGKGNEDMAAGILVGNERFQASAAHVHARQPETLRMFYWTRIEGSGTRLLTMSAKLAETVNETERRVSKGLEWAMELHLEHSPTPELETEGFLVDYGILSGLKDSAILSSKVETAARQGAFKNAVVLLGDMHPEMINPQDLLLVPGQTHRYPGVLLHGCAVDTLLNAPLFELTLWGRVAVDLLLALLVLLVLTGLEAIQRKRQSTQAHSNPWLAILIVVSVALLVGVIGVKLTRVMWDDFPFVVLGLILHRPLDQLIQRRVTKRPEVGTPSVA